MTRFDETSRWPLAPMAPSAIESGDRISYRLRIGELAMSLARGGPVGVGLCGSSGHGTAVDGFPLVVLGMREVRLATLDHSNDLAAGPETFTGMIWAPDLTWWVSTDIDLDYTLIGASASVIDAHLADPRFESLAITGAFELPLRAQIDAIG